MSGNESTGYRALLTKNRGMLSRVRIDCIPSGCSTVMAIDPERKRNPRVKIPTNKKIPTTETRV